MAKRIYAKFSSQADAKAIRGLRKAFAGSQVQKFASGWRVIEIDDNESVDYATEVYGTSPDVVSAEPERNISFTPQDIPEPDDPAWAGQYSLTRSGFPAAWDVCDGSGRIVVAVIDDGVAMNHPDFMSEDFVVVPGCNVVAGDHGLDPNDPSPDNAFNTHGTRCASIICAVKNNNYGIAGAAHGVRVMPIKLWHTPADFDYTDEWFPTTPASFAAAIETAVLNGAHIISMSWAASEANTMMLDSFAWAYEQGVLCVNAAGNSGSSTLFSSGVMPPSTGYGVYAVSGCDVADVFYEGQTWSSNQGDHVELMAGCVNVPVCSFNTGAWTTTTSSGTSFASPLVSAAAALVWLNRPHLSAREVMAALASTADDVYETGWAPTQGYGIPRVDLALAFEDFPPRPQVPHFVVDGEPSDTEVLVTFRPDPEADRYMVVVGYERQVSISQSIILPVVYSSAQPTVEVALPRNLQYQSDITWGDVLFYRAETRGRGGMGKGTEVSDLTGMTGEVPEYYPLYTPTPPITAKESGSGTHASLYDGAIWASHTQMAGFMNHLVGVGYETIAISDGGRSVPMLSIGNPEGPVILVVAGQHGDEPAAPEAALRFIRDLTVTEDQDLLQALQIYRVCVVPLANPDGYAIDTRGTLSVSDMNREHHRLLATESSAVQRVIRDLAPEMVIDVHEWASADALTTYGAYPGNLNVDAALMGYCEDLLWDGVRPATIGAGFAFRWYPRTFGNIHLPGMLLNTGALRHAATVLLETPTDDGEPEERVAQHRVSLNAILRYAVAHPPALACEQSRLSAVSDGANQSSFYDPDLVVSPLAYRLTGEQYGAAEHVATVLGFDAESTTDGVFISMAHESRSLVPQTFDETSDYVVVAGARIMSDEPTLTATPTPTHISLEWSDPATAIERSDNGGTYTLIATNPTSPLLDTTASGTVQYRAYIGGVWVYSESVTMPTRYDFLLDFVQPREYDLLLDFYNIQIPIGTANEVQENLDLASMTKIMRLPHPNDTPTNADSSSMFATLLLGQVVESSIGTDAASLDILGALRYDLSLDFGGVISDLPFAVEQPENQDLATVLQAVKNLGNAISGSTNQDASSVRLVKLVGNALEVVSEYDSAEMDVYFQNNLPTVVEVPTGIDIGGMVGILQLGVAMELPRGSDSARLTGDSHWAVDKPVEGVWVARRNDPDSWLRNQYKPKIWRK